MPAPIAAAQPPRIDRAPAQFPEPGADERRLEQDLRHAVAQGQFVLHYQPRVSLASLRTVGAEALIRWPHRKRGMVPPGAFIHLAERNGLITPIGGWVLRTAGAEAASWPVPVGISVNVSARQLADGVLLEQVEAALASGLAPERLELELTESMLVDAGIETLMTLSAIRDLGVGLALDDFGTGYASLATLKRLPLTVMKLDRSLVQGLPHYREDAAITRALVEMGHALSLTLVAEGIATQAQRAFLTEIGCDEAQSFLFSRPLPPERFRARLAAEAG
ncbi:MAG: EAL domain-containing protein [Acidisphaera sp.]|nr:EAL domain-containing protein [Acidisphaera sp.]